MGNPPPSFFPLAKEEQRNADIRNEGNTKGGIKKGINVGMQETRKKKGGTRKQIAVVKKEGRNEGWMERKTGCR